MVELLARSWHDVCPLVDILLLDFLYFELGVVNWLDFETSFALVALAAVYDIAGVWGKRIEEFLNILLATIQVAAILAVDDVFRLAFHARLIPRVEFGCKQLSSYLRRLGLVELETQISYHPSFSHVVILWAFLLELVERGKD